MHTLTLHCSSALLFKGRPVSHPTEKHGMLGSSNTDEVIMKIQVLYFEDCPNYKAAVELVERTADQMRVSADIELVYIDSPESANANRFLGSPTIRVEGVDIDPAARDQNDFGLSCRRYGSSGVPAREMIVDALKRRNGGSK